MKFNFKTLAAFLALSTMMTGCSKDDTSSNGSLSPLLNTTDKTSASAESQVRNEIAAPTEIDCTISFDNEKIASSGNGAQVSDKTVKITKSGVYELSGSCLDCKIQINAGKDDEITLLLNNVTLASQNGSVIDCEKAKTLVLFSNEGTKNSLSDSENYASAADGDPDAAVFTRSDLIINGSGELNVDGKYGDAVKCKDAVVIYDGNVNVISADDGITGKDSVTVCGGVVNIVSGGDGIKSTNDTDADKGDITVAGGEINIESAMDGIQAEKDLTVDNAKITITAGGAAADEEVKAQDSPWDFDKRGSGSQSTGNAVSQKGIKAGGNITIGSGEFDIKSADDSIHSNASIDVKNGSFKLSSCDDGIHADENLKVSDGTITVTKSYEGLEGKNIEIDGGTINVTAADDGLNAAGGDNGSFFGFGEASDDYYIRISGGDITVNAGGDGIDSNGTIAQSGGVLTIYGPTNSGNGAIDYEKSYAMSGGTLIALGSQGMAQTPSTLSQPCLSISASAAAGDIIEVRDGSDVIITVTTPKNAQSLIFSSEEFKAGTEYGIYVGGELAVTVTAEEGVSGNGGSGQGGFGNHGGRPGGQGGFDGHKGQGGFPGFQGGQVGDPPEIPNGSDRPELPNGGERPDNGEMMR